MSWFRCGFFTGLAYGLALFAIFAGRLWPLVAVSAFASFLCAAFAHLDEKSRS